MNKPSIRQNIYGNWYGYLGKRKVEWFNDTSEASQEEQARKWLSEERERLVREVNRNLAQHIAPTDCELDTLRAANHKLASEIANLTRYLNDAWTIGADHRKPTFEQLNEWRSAIAEATK